MDRTCERRARYRITSYNVCYTKLLRYVRAAAAGEVVYAGNGLGGYVHLVIVKHNDHFLSAYSFNSVGGVREGKQVKAGENLARVVAAARDSRILHFEIRRDGRAVDPRTVIGR